MRKRSGRWSTLLHQAESGVVDQLALGIQTIEGQGLNELRRTVPNPQSRERPEAEAAIVTRIADQRRSLAGQPQSPHRLGHQGTADPLSVLRWQNGERADQDRPQSKERSFRRPYGGDAAWGRIASLIGTCKINGVEPFAYLTVIANCHPQSDIDDLLPWKFKPSS